MSPPHPMPPFFMFHFPVSKQQLFPPPLPHPFFVFSQPTNLCTCPGYAKNDIVHDAQGAPQPHQFGLSEFSVTRSTVASRLFKKQRK